MDQTNPLAQPTHERRHRAGRLEPQAGWSGSAGRSYLHYGRNLSDRRRRKARTSVLIPVAVAFMPAGGRLRLPDSPPYRWGAQEEADRQGDLAASGRGIDGPPGAGRRADRLAQDHAGTGHRPPLGGLLVHSVGPGRVHRSFRRNRWSACFAGLSCSSNTHDANRAAFRGQQRVRQVVLLLISRSC